MKTTTPSACRACELLAAVLLARPRATIGVRRVKGSKGRVWRAHVPGHDDLAAVGPSEEGAFIALRRRLLLAVRAEARRLHMEADRLRTRVEKLNDVADRVGWKRGAA